MKKITIAFLLAIFLVSTACFAFYPVPAAEAATQSPHNSFITQIEQKIVQIFKHLANLKTKNTASLTGSVPAAPAPQTASPTAAPSINTVQNLVAPTTPWCYNFSGSMQYGSRGTQVAALQTALQKEGFTISSSDITNQRFGSSTRAAVVAFQKKYLSQGLATGYVGSLTLAQLNRLYGCAAPTVPPVVTPPPPPPVPTPTPTPVPVPTPTPPPPPPPSAPVPPITSSVLWGAYTGDSYSTFTSFQQQVGKTANIQAMFLGWNDPFPTSWANSLKNNNQTLLIYWEQYGVTVDQINSGSSDNYIRQFALSAKNSGASVILAPLHEMNGNWDPWDGTVGNNTPAKVITEWRHLHDLFTDATNVKWGWAVNNESVPNTAANAITSYYPGDAYVDYVGVDGFNFADPWQTFSQVFSSALQTVSAYNKPIMIFSMACAPGSQKAGWITDALAQMYANPNIAGWVWFNQNKEQNWLISSDSASLQAFHNGIH